MQLGLSSKVRAVTITFSISCTHQSQPPSHGVCPIGIASTIEIAQVKQWAYWLDTLAENAWGSLVFPMLACFLPQSERDGIVSVFVALLTVALLCGGPWVIYYGPALMIMFTLGTWRGNTSANILSNFFLILIWNSDCVIMCRKPPAHDVSVFIVFILVDFHTGTIKWSKWAAESPSTSVRAA